MKFINIMGDTRLFVTLQNISCIEETKDGCKIHLVGGVESITTGVNYDEITSCIIEMIGGTEG